MKHIMIDLETLDTVANAAIISIGAVRFDLESSAIDGGGFYASVSIDSNIRVGRSINEDTLKWWMSQSIEAQKVFHEPKQALSAALLGLSEWIGNPDVLVWSNGADFDLPMLAHAYRQLDLPLPWKFYNSRCARTYKNLPCAAKVERPQTGVAHNALSDAFNQALHMQAIHAELTK